MPRLPEVAVLLLALGAFGLLVVAAGHILTAAEPQPNRSHARKGFRSAAVGAYVAGSVGAAIDLAFGLHEYHFTAWGLTIGAVAGAMHARTRWSPPDADR